MRSIYLILAIYISLYFYGEKVSLLTSTPEETTDTILLKKAVLPIYHKNGQKIAELTCDSLDYNFEEFSGVNIKFQVYPKQTDLEKITITAELKELSLPNTDLIINANHASFKKPNQTIYLVGDVKATYGQDIYLEADQCTWAKNNSLLLFPNQFSLQKGEQFIKGKNAIFNSKNKDLQIEKDVVAFFEMPENNKLRTNNKTYNLSKLTSEGKLIYSSNYQTIQLLSQSYIKNQKFTLQADTITANLNEANQLKLINAEGNIKVLLLDKNVVAVGPKAVLDFEEHRYNFLDNHGITPYIDLNGYRQSAKYIVYNETTGILKAGPEVKSIKIPQDSKE